MLKSLETEHTSDNGVEVKSKYSNTGVTPNKMQTLTIDVDADAKTGYNDANSNVGDVMIHTGNAKAER